LKDYMNAKLLFCHPPPSVPEDAFNERTRQMAIERAAGKKHAPVTRVGAGADTAPAAFSSQAVGQGPKSRVLDQDFFESNGALGSRPFVQGSARDGKEFSRTRLYPHQNAVSDDGTSLTGRRARIAAVLTSAGADSLAGNGKRHKKMPRVKQRSGKGYD
jgi:large subunit GTPase 1